MQKLFLQVLPFVLFLGCQSVPSDAPKELHEAADAVKQVHKEDMEKVMPISVKKADDTLASSIDLWKENKSPEDRKRSIQQAVEAKNLAENVTKVGTTLKKWDRNIRLFENTMAMVSEVNALKEQLAKVQSESKDAVSPFAMLKDVSFVAPVVFFDFNKTKVGQNYESDLKSLAELMKRQEHLTMTLTGYADRRGNSDYNKQLAMARARNVAAQFEKMGIGTARITVFSAGPVDEQANRRTAAKYQLDRKVVASLGFR